MDKIQEQKIKAFISKNVFIDGRCGQPDQTIFREIIFDSKIKTFSLSARFLMVLLTGTLKANNSA